VALVAGTLVVGCGGDGSTPPPVDAGTDAGGVSDGSLDAGPPPSLDCFGAWPACCDEGPTRLPGVYDREAGRWVCPDRLSDHCDCELSDAGS